MLNIENVIFEHSLWGHKLRGRVVIESGYAGDCDEPGYPTIATVEVVYLDNGLLDCYDALNPALIHELEETITRDYDDNN